MKKRTLLILLAIVIIVGIITTAGIFTYQEKRYKKLLKFADAHKAASMNVRIYFDNTKNNPNATDCGAVFATERNMPKNKNLTEIALKELFKGPLTGEKSLGYSSPFSSETSNILQGIKIENKTAYINLIDIRKLMPNVTTSCGSAQFMSEIEKTVKYNTGVENIVIAIDKNPKTFYEWMQIGCDKKTKNCDAKPFETL
ncbi:MAG: Spore germination protein-like protein Gmad2 [Candidatus Peregrinibacteria bacterium GW2011_GWF2_38_29]|nr:MAG: Spore germination protein-like protein Gmad2 [Candidatus Peregrinibacteria bacterium GW2011_GWF2_38_29]HBB03143.1 hypothetical protein [Candidatus Peregrinibacteria bacterium]